MKQSCSKHRPRPSAPKHPARRPRVSRTERLLTARALRDAERRAYADLDARDDFLRARAERGILNGEPEDFE